MNFTQFANFGLLFAYNPLLTIIPLFMRNRLILLAFFGTLSVQAQISEGGLPPSFQPDNQAVLSGKMPAPQTLAALNVATALSEDSHNPGQNRFAAPIAVDITLEHSGTWQTLPNGDRVWLCALQSTGALGLTILFDAFKLPAGARFFAYGSNQQVLGAYTAQSCLSSGKFLIGVIKGEKVFLELFEPASAQGQSKISTKRIDVAYDGHALNGAEDFGTSLPCNVNVNCAAGSTWQAEKKGVARILMVFSNGEGWCSGTLIANTSNSYEPNFLTAHHCQLIGNNPDFSLWRFDFDYESVDCSNPGTEPVPHSVLGSQRLAYRQETDFMLLKLNPIPPSYDVYFNGWNRDGNASTIPPKATYIHHPDGDIKKISVDNQAVTIHPSVLDWGPGFGTSPGNSHWKSIPDVGIFQPGSSGCPIFDANKRIVGQLHGGGWNAMDPCIIFSAFFGRFNLSWDQGSTANTRLKEWLDAANTGAVTQNGYTRPVVVAYSLNGNIKTHWGVPMQEVRIDITGGTTVHTFTDSLGNYNFNNIPVGGNYTLQPSFDFNDLNGVTTYDLVLTSKHILGIETLDSPWKIIAADINKSGSMTSFDIVEARKVILGINPSFPANTSWRFWPATTVFLSPTNPFMGGLPPESIKINNLQANFSGADFKGVKVGDLNNSAVGN